MLKACMLGCALTLATLGSALADGDVANVPLNFPSAGISAANASFAARHDASDG